jgi:hypothetical protein
MESHDNVAYLKCKGWYTNQRNIPNGHYMDATHQAIVQRYQRLEDMPKTAPKTMMSSWKLHNIEKF